MTPDEALQVVRMMWQQTSATPEVHQRISTAIATLEMVVYPPEVPNGQAHSSPAQEHPEVTDGVAG